MIYCHVLVYSLNPIIFVHSNGKTTTKDIGKALTWEARTFRKKGKIWLNEVKENFDAKVCLIEIKGAQVK